LDAVFSPLILSSATPGQIRLPVINCAQVLTDENGHISERVYAFPPVVRSARALKVFQTAKGAAVFALIADGFACTAGAAPARRQRNRLAANAALKAGYCPDEHDDDLKAAHFAWGCICQARAQLAVSLLHADQIPTLMSHLRVLAERHSSTAC
jgi:hypothetical protein